MPDEIKTAINFAFRDFNTPGLPASGPKEIDKAEVRLAGQIASDIVDDLVAGQATGIVIFETVAQAAANLNYVANTGAQILADPAGDVENGNGYYRKLGASGVGSWDWIAPLLTENTGIFETVTEAAGNLNYAAGSGALVMADPDGDVPDGNGYYQKLGASGAGSWDWIAPLHQPSFLRVITTDEVITVGVAEAGVALNKTVEAEAEVNIPSAATRNTNGGTPIVIKDMKRNSGTYKFRIIPAAGTIDGFTSFTVMRDGAAVQLRPLADGSGYLIASITG